MVTVDLPDTTPVEWDDWRTPLRQFTEATGLVTSAYDVARRAPHRSADRFAHGRAAGRASTLWAEDGPGTAFERTLVQQTAGRRQVGIAAASCEGLRVCTQPLLLRGEVYGVLVFGWRFADFSSPLACERIAKPDRLARPSAVERSAARRRRCRTSAWAPTRRLLATLSSTLDRQREAIDDLMRVNRTRELFLATVSHEMRTPLSALSMRIELLLRTIARPAAGRGQRACEAMRVHVRQEAGMVEDLIDAARTLTGQMSIDARAGRAGPGPARRHLDGGDRTRTPSRSCCG